jgi:hypothetical protein
VAERLLASVRGSANRHDQAVVIQSSTSECALRAAVPTPKF